MEQFLEFIDFLVLFITESCHLIQLCVQCFDLNCQSLALLFMQSQIIRLQIMLQLQHLSSFLKFCRNISIHEPKSFNLLLQRFNICRLSNSIYHFLLCPFWLSAVEVEVFHCLSECRRIELVKLVCYLVEVVLAGALKLFFQFLKLCFCFIMIFLRFFKVNLKFSSFNL